MGKKKRFLPFRLEARYSAAALEARGEESSEWWSQGRFDDRASAERAESKLLSKRPGLYETRVVEVDPGYPS